jgi:catechol 2,3-dioxygenase-like lactoylglutathione lyase family enzyme
MTKTTLPGIHHIAAICGDPQRNVNFYVRLLGPNLMLPASPEPRRKALEARLPELRVPGLASR